MSIGSHCEHPILFLVLRPHIFFFYDFLKQKKKTKTKTKKKKTKTKEEII